MNDTRQVDAVDLLCSWVFLCVGGCIFFFARDSWNDMTGSARCCFIWFHVRSISWIIFFDSVYVYCYIRLLFLLLEPAFVNIRWISKLFSSSLGFVCLSFVHCWGGTTWKFKQLAIESICDKNNDDNGTKPSRVNRRTDRKKNTTINHTWQKTAVRLTLFCRWKLPFIEFNINRN